MIGLLAALLASTIVADVRQAAASGELARAEQTVKEFQKGQGVTPESLEAYSWIARGALAAKKYDEASKYAAETRKQVLAKVSAAKLDSDPRLAIALGAAIEVEAHALAAREGRSSGISYLQGEMASFGQTSIRTRLQKNINLLSLEGKPAPKLAGAALPVGKPALLFFWAHWCGDCKGSVPMLNEVQAKYPDVRIITPTKLYGYVAGGEDAPPAVEQRWIEKVRRDFYGSVKALSSPVNTENMTTYGVSTTPTLVLVDGRGIVQLYHPGSMTFGEMDPALAKLTATQGSRARTRPQP